MIKRNNKKGFTIVELVIVIAVIAILAAVLIPTFAGIIKKANESADLQAVRQMNTILAAEDAYKGGLTINDAVAALKEAGLNGDDYIALVSGRYFFYDVNENRIVYTEYKDGKYNVIFPEDFSTEGHQTLSLSGDIAKEEYDAPDIDEAANTATFSINTAEQYAQLAADIKSLVEENKTNDKLPGFTVDKIGTSQKIKGISGKNVVIELAEDIDFKGASFNLHFENGSFTLKGNDHTISGIVNNSGFAISDGNASKEDSEYGGAFLGYVSDATILFENVTFKNCHFGNESVKASSIFVGQLNGESTVTFKNTNVDNCTISGSKGIAIYLGHACESEQISVKFEGTNTVSNCQLTSTGTDENADQIATIIGRVSGTNNKVSGTAPTFSNVTMTNKGSAVENAAKRSIVAMQNNTYVATEYTGTEWSN